MTVNDILEYVMNTPNNTNKVVLKGMLDSLVDSAAADADADDPVAESITITENGTTTAPEGKVYDEVIVNVPAPPSEITTAQVTVENDGGGLDDPYISLLIMDNDAITAKTVTYGTYTVALYNGSLKAVIEGTASAVATGDCQIDGYNAIITGDCTINL